MEDLPEMDSGKPPTEPDSWLELLHLDDKALHQAAGEGRVADMEIEGAMVLWSPAVADEQNADGPPDADAVKRQRCE